MTDCIADAAVGSPWVRKMRRGLAGMGGRWLSTPNAWDPTEESVAQYTAEHEHDGVFHDDVTPPDTLSISMSPLRRVARSRIEVSPRWPGYLP